MVVLVCSELEGECPELDSDDCGPTSHCMQELNACFAREDTDIAFCYPILPMGADATERLALLLTLNVFDEGFAGVNAVVTAIMADVNVVFESETLKICFRLNGGDRTSGFLWTGVYIFRDGVNEDSRACIATLGRLSGLERNETTDLRDHLVSGNEVARTSGFNVDDVFVVGRRGGWQAVHAAAKTTRANYLRAATCSRGETVLACTGPGATDLHVNVATASVELEEFTLSRAEIGVDFAGGELLCCEERIQLVQTC